MTDDPQEETATGATPLDGDPAAERLSVAREAARAGATVAAEGFRGGLDVETKEYATDTVTAADRNAQERVTEVIAETFPDEPVVGEEGDAPETVPADGPAWIVDPIDGTNNFVREFQVWCTAVACVVDGERRAAAVECPMLEDSFAAGPAGVPAVRSAGTTRNGTPVTASERTDPEESHVGVLLWWPMDERGEFSAALDAAITRFADIRRIGSAQATLAHVAMGTLEGAFTTVAGPPWDTVAGVHLIEQAGGRATDVHGEPWTPDAEGLVVSNGALHDELLAAARETLDAR